MSTVIKLKKPRKPKACAVCQDAFVPRRLGQKTCDDYACAISLGKIIAQAARLKTARKDRREYRAKTKTIGKLLQEAQKEFNRFIRERDFGLPCICCGKFTSSDALTGGDYDAGHFRTVGSAGHLRFNEDNCHRQLKSCNQGSGPKGSNYRARLIEKIGIARVEALESDNAPVKWERDALVQIRRTYLSKWKLMKTDRESRPA